MLKITHTQRAQFHQLFRNLVSRAAKNQIGPAAKAFGLPSPTEKKRLDEPYPPRFFRILEAEQNELRCFGA